MHELLANCGRSTCWPDARRRVVRIPSKRGCGGDCGQSGRCDRLRGRGKRMTAKGSARVNGAAPRTKLPSSPSRGTLATPSARTGRLPTGLAAVLAVLSSSAVVLDSDDRVLEASEAARTFGLVNGDALVVGELLALARQVRRDGEIREGEIDISTGRIPNKTTSFAVRVAPLGAEVGGGGLVLLLVEDQTERRRVEEVRRDFVANTSHELKTPVGALALLAETVEDAADDPEAVRRFAGRMRQEAGRLTNLVQEMITPSRIQATEPVPDPVPVELDAVVAQALDRCRLKASAR